MVSVKKMFDKENVNGKISKIDEKVLSYKFPVTKGDFSIEDKGREIILFAKPDVDPIAKYSGIPYVFIRGRIDDIKERNLEVRVKVSNSLLWFKREEETKRVPYTLIITYCISD